MRAEIFHADRRDEANSHSAAILPAGLKIRHPFSFNWPVSEDRDFSTNWTTADETQRLFHHQCITLCRKHFALHFLLSTNCLQYTVYCASYINHAECGTVKADSHMACRAHAIPMSFPCHAVPLIHTRHAAPPPCSDSAVSFVKIRVPAGNIRTASPTV